MSILQRDNWTTQEFDFIISDIIEYDMKRAGLSIIKEKKLLDDETIMQLEKMDKHLADERVGKMQISNKELRDSLKAGFVEYRLKFGEANELEDKDIISVKKDAIFVKRYCEVTEFDTHVKFVEKNHYEAFMKLQNMEFYYDPEKLDVKGLHKDNEALHKDYMIGMIHGFIRHLSMSDIARARDYLVRFMDDYKKLRLPVGYYREFNSDSGYLMGVGDSVIRVGDVGEDCKRELRGEYNYLNVLVPLLNFVV